MKIADLRKRVDRAKERSAPPVRRYDNRVVVARRETIADAASRHVERNGQPPRNVSLFAMPAKPRTPDEIAAWEQDFLESQTALIANAKRERLSLVQPETPFVSPFPPGAVAKLPRFIVPKPWKAM